MKTIVISLGGSVIVPNKVNYKYLKKFKKLISKFSRKHKVVIVCGGGKTARKYIDSLKSIKLDKKIYCLIGIAATRLNARLVEGLFNKKEEIPENTNQVKNLLKKHNLVICGALGYKPHMTSDGTAAELAKSIKADFLINVTNVPGLFNKDPKKYKNAKFIKEISFANFDKMVNKIKFKVGQHFVLDQTASKIVKDAKIKTIIISQDLKNIQNLLYNKNFKGTIIH